MCLCLCVCSVDSSTSFAVMSLAWSSSSRASASQRRSRFRGLCFNSPLNWIVVHFVNVVVVVVLICLCQLSGVGVKSLPVKHFSATVASASKTSTTTATTMTKTTFSSTFSFLTSSSTSTKTTKTTTTSSLSPSSRSWITNKSYLSSSPSAPSSISSKNAARINAVDDNSWRRNVINRFNETSTPFFSSSFVNMAAPPRTWRHQHVNIVASSTTPSDEDAKKTNSQFSFDYSSSTKLFSRHFPSPSQTAMILSSRTLTTSLPQNTSIASHRNDSYHNAAGYNVQTSKDRALANLDSGRLSYQIRNKSRDRRKRRSPEQSFIMGPGQPFITGPGQPLITGQPSLSTFSDLVLANASTQVHF